MDPEFSTAPAAKSAAKRARPPLGARIGITVGIFLGCVGGLVAVLAPAVWSAREAARRAQCSCNFCAIRLALHNYHAEYGALPPAFVADAHGKPMHSWRVLILPFMEYRALYDRYDFREPWDGPKNIKLLNEMPAVYSCPSRNPDKPGTRTSYVALTGPGTIFPGAASARFADVTDGLANTLMVVEVSNLNVPWTAPRDLDVRVMSLRVNDPNRPGISSPHPGGANVTLADATTLFLRDSIAPADLKALTTIAGGEAVDGRRALSGK